MNTKSKKTISHVFTMSVGEFTVTKIITYSSDIEKSICRIQRTGSSVIEFHTSELEDFMQALKEVNEA